MLTIILTLQVRLKGVKCCAQQNILIICKVAIYTKFCQFGKGLFTTLNHFLQIYNSQQLTFLEIQQIKQIKLNG